MVSEFLPGQPLQHAIPVRAATWIELALATPVVLWGGWPFFVRGWASVVNRSLNMFTLIALGVGAAYLYSVVATLAPGLFPASFRVHGGRSPVYFEPAAVIVVLVLLGQVLELRARSRTSSAIRALLGLAPKTARRRRSRWHASRTCRSSTCTSAIGCASGPASESRSMASYRRPSAVDESMVTGEPIPVEKEHGDRSPAAPSTAPARFVIEAETRRQGHAARADRADGQRGAAHRGRRFSGWRTPCRRWFVPAVIAVRRHDFRRVGDCRSGAAARPRARERGGRAHHRVPVRAGSGDADVDHGRHRPRRQAGVLIRNAEALEVLEQVDTLVVDKTGTLTEGKPTLVTRRAAPGIDETMLLRAGGEPGARAASTRWPRPSSPARERAALRSVAVRSFASVTGRGVSGHVEGRTVAVGNRGAISSRSRDRSAELGRAGGRARAMGRRSMFVAMDGRPAGLLGVADPIKPSTRRGGRCAAR